MSRQSDKLLSTVGSSFQIDERNAFWSMGESQILCQNNCTVNSSCGNSARLNPDKCMPISQRIARNSSITKHFIDSKSLNENFFFYSNSRPRKVTIQIRTKFVSDKQVSLIMKTIVIINTLKPSITFHSKSTGLLVSTKQNVHFLLSFKNTATHGLMGKVILSSNSRKITRRNVKSTLHDCGFVCFTSKVILTFL